MNSYQRRLVHHLANQYEHLSTKSYGEGKDRYIEIQYHEN
ncbi:MAG: protein jag, partial [Bacilli bacterium]|nr:protein jag [Bacilli bacterium]